MTTSVGTVLVKEVVVDTTAVTVVVPVVLVIVLVDWKISLETSRHTVEAYPWSLASPSVVVTVDIDRYAEQKWVAVLCAFSKVTARSTTSQNSFGVVLGNGLARATLASTVKRRERWKETIFERLAERRYGKRWIVL